MTLQSEYKGTHYTVEAKGGMWNWRVFYPKKLGEFTSNGWATSEANADRDAKAAIDQIRN